METSLVSLICLWGWVHTRQWRCTMLYSTVSCLDPEWSIDMKIMELTYTNSDKKLNGLQGYLPLPLYSLYRVIIARELKHNRHHNYFPHTDIIYPLPITFCATPCLCPEPRAPHVQGGILCQKFRRKTGALSRKNLENEKPGNLSSTWIWIIS